MKLWLHVLTALLVCNTAAHASGWNLNSAASAPHTPQQLEWGNSQQQLLYRSCGCADGCWEARLYQRTTESQAGADIAPIASISCDCEKLFVARGNEKPHLYADSCAAINTSDDKFSSIRATMHKIVTPPEGA